MSPRLRLIAFASLVGGLFLRTFGLIAYPTAPLVDCDWLAALATLSRPCEASAVRVRPHHGGYHAADALEPTGSDARPSTA